MPDLFNSQSKLGGTFKGTAFALSVGGGNNGGNLKGALVQSVQLNYSRQISRIFELGSTDQYFIEGRSEGQASLQQIVGPQGLINPILSALGNTCTANQRVLQLSAAANTCGFNAAASGGNALSLESPVVTNYSLGSQASNFVIDTGMQLMFVGLSN